MNRFNKVAMGSAQPWKIQPVATPKKAPNKKMKAKLNTAAGKALWGTSGKNATFAAPAKGMAPKFKPNTYKGP